MASLIDTTLPIHGSAFDDVREALGVARDEITALQAGGMGGPAGGDLSGNYPNPNVATVGGTSAATVAGNLPSSGEKSALAGVSGVPGPLNRYVTEVMLAAASGVATLDVNGKIQAAQIPSIAITDVYVVASQVAMLALPAEQGDVAIRTDLLRTYILAAPDPTILANWIEMPTPTDLVVSVAGKTGIVLLDKSDVGLGNVDNTADADKNVLYAVTAGSATPSAHAASHSLLGTDPITIDESQVTGLTGDLSGLDGRLDTVELDLNSATATATANTLVRRDADAGFETAYLAVDTTPTVPQTGGVGKVVWNDVAGTLEFGLKGGNVTLQLGQEQVLYVRNMEVTPMTDGTVVYLNGSTGIHMSAYRADMTTEPTSDRTIGLVTEPIADHPGEGYITTFGLVRGLDTHHLTEGALVYLSTAGTTTATKPVAPNHCVIIGYCVKKSAGAGIIFVNVQVGWEIGELHDVTVTAPANGNYLQYDGTKWVNNTVLTSGRIPFVTTSGRLTDSSTWTRNATTGQVTQTYNGTTAVVYQLTNTNAAAAAQAYTQYTVDAGSWYFGAESNAGGLSPGGAFIYSALAKTFRIYTAGVQRLEVSGAGVFTSAATANLFTAYGKFGVATVGANTLLAVGRAVGNFGGSTAAAHFVDDQTSATVNFQNTNVLGYTAFDFFNSANTKVASFAWSNASASFPNTMWISTRTATDMWFGTNTTERLRITATGEVRVANLTGGKQIYTDATKGLTTTPPAGSPGHYKRSFLMMGG